MTKATIYPQLKKPFKKLSKHLKTSPVGAVILPTGYGKTTIGLRTIQDLHKPGTKQVLLGPNYNVWEAFQKADPSLSQYCRFYTYLTLARSKNPLGLLKESNPQVVVLDEFHRTGAKVWKRAVSGLFNQEQIKVVGVTATETRFLDNCRNMAVELFGRENIVIKKTLTEAIEEGFFKKPKLIHSFFSIDRQLEEIEGSENLPNLSQDQQEYIHRKLVEIRKSFSGAKMVPAALKKHCDPSDYKFIFFIDSVDELQRMRPTINEWLKEAFPGRPATILSVTHKHTKAEKKEIVKRFLENRDPKKLDVMLSVNILNESLHDSDLTCCVLLRSTKSLIITLQQIGRTLTAGSSKTPKIFDFVNNIKQLSAWADYRDFSILGEEREDTDPVKDAGEVSFEGARRPRVIPFEIIDETHDFVEAFSELEHRVSDWNFQYSLLKQYVKKHKKLPKTNSGSLSQFVRDCRKKFKQGILTETQIQLLNELDINLVVEKTKDQWNVNFEKFKAASSIDEHGNFVQPKSTALTAWFSRQKGNAELSQEKKDLIQPFVEAIKKLEIIPVRLSIKEKQLYAKNVEHVILTHTRPSCCGIHMRINTTKSTKYYRCGKCGKSQSLLSSFFKNAKISKSYVWVIGFLAHAHKQIAKIQGIPGVTQKGRRAKYVSMNVTIYPYYEKMALQLQPLYTKEFGEA